MDMLRVYKGEPTEGLTDGMPVSSGSWVRPIHPGVLFTPRDGYEESEPIKLAVRCAKDLHTVEYGGRHGDIELVGETRDFWRLAWSLSDLETASWGYDLPVPEQITDRNLVFYAQARVHADESPQVDRSVFIRPRAFISEFVGELHTFWPFLGLDFSKEVYLFLSHDTTKTGEVGICVRAAMTTTPRMARVELELPVAIHAQGYRYS